MAAPVLSGISNVNGGVQIKWDKVTGAAKYRVFRKTGSGSWSKMCDTSSLTYTDRSVKNGTGYSYTVRCISSDGRSYTSALNSVGKKTTYIAVTQISRVANNATKTATVKWSQNKAATGYQIQYSTSSNYSSKKTVGISKGSITSKSIGSLAKGKTYYFRIRVYKKVGGNNVYSAWSTTKKVKINK